MKKIICFLAVIAIVTINAPINGQTAKEQLENIASSPTEIMLHNSPIGSLLYKINDKKTLVLQNSMVWEKAINGHWFPDILLIIDDQRCRSVLLSDGRRIIINNIEGFPWFGFIADYYDDRKLEPNRLVECVVDGNGTVIQLSTANQIDPAGKDGYIVNSGGACLPTNGKNPIPTNDSTVVRYRQEISKLLKLLHAI